MSYIKGKFKHIIFESESGYRVGLFKVNETDDENIPTNKLITYTGYFMKTNDNDNYVLNGKYIFHDRYGYIKFLVMIVYIKLKKIKVI